MTHKQRIDFIVDYFGRTMPDAASELHYENAFQLLVATMLSAQCTDKRVNMVTPALFTRYPDAQAMAHATEEQLLEYVSSVSYPNSKARHLVQMAQMLCTDFGGIVPSTMDELTRLPGVGRKTANVVMAVAFGLAAMPVDTHVFRVSHRLAIVPTTANTPEKVEKALVAALPTPLLAKAHHWLLLHGRYTCTSRAPHCNNCGLKTICKSKTHH